MITIRPWAEFRADFPNDQIEDEDDIVQFGGRNVAEAIARIVRGLDCEVSEPVYAGDHGWELYMEFKRAFIRAQITSLSPTYLLLLKDEPPLFFSKNNTKVYICLLAKLGEALARDGRFHDIAWHEYEQPAFGEGGADTPVTGKIPDITAIKGRRSVPNQILTLLRIRRGFDAPRAKT